MTRGDRVDFGARGRRDGNEDDQMHTPMDIQAARSWLAPNGAALAPFVAALGILLLFFLAPQAACPASLDPELESALDRGTESTLRVILVHTALDGAPHALAGSCAPAPDCASSMRALHVQELQRSADLARRNVEPLLQDLDLAGEIRRVRRHWILPATSVEATPRAIRRLAREAGVSEIILDRREKLILPADAEGPETIADGRSDASRPAPAHARPDASSGTLTLTQIAWGVSAVRAPEVWNLLGKNGHGVLVATLDTGVDYNHPDLAAHIWQNPGEIAGNGKDDDGNGYIDDVRGYDFALDVANPMDDQGHGTHTAGTIVGDGTLGTATGVAPGATLMPLKVLSGGYGYESDSWAALEYAVAEGADVISMSLGWIQCYHHPSRALWRQLAEDAAAAGVLLVAAAGNEGDDYGDPWYCPPPANIRTPADVPSVEAVGATSAAGAVASFSGIGPVTWSGVTGYNDYPYPPGLRKPDVAAPGVDIMSTLPGSRYSPPTWDGTSMACPHVAGAAALILSANPYLSPAEVRSLLTETAHDIAPAGPDNYSGAGLIDAYAAVLAAMGVPGVAVVDEPALPSTPAAAGTRLAPPAPNPANPEVGISFHLASSAQVSLAIYDAQGRAVARLADEVLPAGDHRRRWDGRSSQGEPAASGLYLVRLAAGPDMLVEKLVLAR